MHTLFRTLTAACLLASIALPQARTIPSYKSQEEYCAANPKMPTCIKFDHPLSFSTGVLTEAQTKSLRNLSGATRTGTAGIAGARPKMNAVPLELSGGKPDWRFAHPNASMLMSINLQSLLNSPAMETAINQISGQLSTQIPGLHASDLAKARAWMKGVDHIYASIYSNGAASQGLVVVTGRFDQQLLSTFQVDAATQAKVMNAGAILFGDDASLAQATRRLAGTASPSSLAQTAQSWASRYDFWMMATPALLAGMPANMKKNSGVPDLSSIRSFSLGMVLSSDMRLDIVVDATSTQVAQQLAAAIRSGQLQQAGLQDYSKNLRVDTNGTALQISATIDQKQLSRGLGARMARGNSGVSAPVLAVETNPNAKPNRVVISGLDDGPKEIPLDEKK